MDTAHLINDSTSLDALLWILQPPFPFSWEMLKLEQPGSHQMSVATSPMRLMLPHCQDKYGWTTDTIQNIHWTLILSAWSKHTPTSQTRTSKILHGWLPVMHMHGQTTGCTQCPGCDHDDETFEHMLCCLRPHMMAMWGTVEGKLQVTGHQLGIPKIFMTTFGYYLRGALQGQQEVDLPTPLSQRIYTAQNQIGSHMFIRGFLSVYWMEAPQHLRIKHLMRLMTNLVSFLWDEVIIPLWTTRNNILHNQENFIS